MPQYKHIACDNQTQTWIALRYDCFLIYKEDLMSRLVNPLQFLASSQALLGIA